MEPVEGPCQGPQSNPYIESFVLSQYGLTYIHTPKGPSTRLEGIHPKP